MNTRGGSRRGTAPVYSRSVSRETVDQTDRLGPGQVARAPAVPGLVLVFAAGKPAAVPIPLSGGELELGRDHPAFAAHPDPRLSRRHVAIRFDGQFVAADLGSRNGTSVDGEPLPPGAARAVTRALRAGDSLIIPVPDLGAFERLGVQLAGERVEGPALQEVLRTAARAAQLGATLHIGGESGAGKEGVARAFHAAGPAPGGPLVAVNCATIPDNLAERLLFGARRGAYSGADADADGYAQAAHGGTLFLDEVAELGPAVQAKLLRLLETSEIVPLGASRPRKIDLRFCSATHRDLRAQVAAGKLREDLYFRIAVPRVIVPPLRERREEIPWLVHGEVARTAGELSVHASFVEACLLRAWPGNVRELLAETRAAVQSAALAGAPRLEAPHLSASAGAAFARADAAPAPAADPPPAPTRAAPPPTRAQLASVLRRSEGNISAAARELGVHRTQLRRWLARHDLDPRAFAPAGAADPDE